MVKMHQREGRLSVTGHADTSEDIFLRISLGNQNGGLPVLLPPRDHVG